ncbi:hypothetical protein B296_00027211 [Ensete ventricosum]|uniref:Uncharacterized protein n=1 Tax=Ensete ventricosum TaxID=4639 RepID=A0A426Y2P3_ENSVE|nr:hypothetical protein B296_00027211 [Ensete ventricosum]
MSHRENTGDGKGSNVLLWKGSRRNIVTLLVAKEAIVVGISSRLRKRKAKVGAAGAEGSSGVPNARTMAVGSCGCSKGLEMVAPVEEEGGLE